MPKRNLKFTDRWMFNRVLCEEEVCRKVLRAALGIEAGEIAYLNAEQCFEPLAAGRGVRLDVFARGDGRVYDIEMQVARERDLGRRMRYYQAAMDVGELGSGEDFGAIISCQQHPCQQHPCQQHPTRSNGHDPRFDTLDPQYRELIAEPNLENVPIWSLSARSSISPFRKTHFPTSADQNITFSKFAKCASYIALFNHLLELVLFHTSILTSSIAQQKYLENVLF